MADEGRFVVRNVRLRSADLMRLLERYLMREKRPGDVVKLEDVARETGIELKVLTKAFALMEALEDVRRA